MTALYQLQPGGLSHTVAAICLCCNHLLQLWSDTMELFARQSQWPFLHYWQFQMLSKNISTGQVLRCSAH